MLKGDLADLPLLDLLQTLATSGKSGVLSVSAWEVEVRVGFRPRRIACARGLGLVGRDALELLMGLRKGKFTFDADKLPREENVKETTTELLADLAEAAEQWRRLRAIPHDWTRVLRRSRLRPSVELNVSELKLYAEVEGKTIAEVLAKPGEVLTRAIELNKQLSLGLLTAALGRGVTPASLNALTLYGPETGVAYLDVGIYRRWAEHLEEQFAVRVRSPRGREAVFRAKPREGIPERILLNVRDLRGLRAARGEWLLVIPEV